MKKITGILLILLAGCAGQNHSPDNIQVSAVPMATSVVHADDYLNVSLQHLFNISHIDIVSNQEKGVVILRRQQGGWPDRLAVRIRNQGRRMPQVHEIDLETDQHFIKAPMYFPVLKQSERKTTLSLPMYNTRLEQPLKNRTVRTTANSAKTYFEMIIPREILQQNPNYLKIRWYQHKSSSPTTNDNQA